MSAKRVNVLVYAGAGSTTSSVRHAVWSLRRLLGPNYAVLTVTGDQILKEPWMASCALLVMPGGADMAYSRTLNGAGNRRIKQYVQMGGRYLGFCAGGYYGAARCEWEVGKKGMEVVGDRELAFFPGICRGLAFGGFEYQSEAGTHAAALQVVKEALATGGGAVPERLRVYYNGGGVFVDADTCRDKGVEVVARYADKLAVEGGDAAMVYCKIGEGGALLTGPHPEFSGTNLNRNEPSAPADYHKVVDALLEDEKQRVDFLKACLIKLGLEVSQQAEAVPSLSLLHFSAAEPGVVSELVQSWHEAGVMVKEDGRELIRGENDTFVLQSDSGNDSWDMAAVHRALTEAAGVGAGESEADPSSDRLLDYNSLPKRMLLHESSNPSSKQTPYFNHAAFFWNLKDYHAQHRDSPRSFGKLLMYGEVVTSTNTLLDKNPAWLATLPTGLVATATTQVAGRGRGSNVWVSPPGSMPFSFVLRHSLALSASAPVVFVQYLAALAVVQGIQAYGPGYSNLAIKLKWPNDIYALDPSSSSSKPSKNGSGSGSGSGSGQQDSYVKLGGILVNSSYAGGDYTLVCGIGLNLSNAGPTTSLSRLASCTTPPLPAMTAEKLLASILAHFEALYTRFCRAGFDAEFEAMYYKHWLHMDQIVTLETEGGARARIKGITTDWGLLVAEELGWQDRPTGKRFSLQSDSNSFDFFRGLVRRKV